MMEQKERPMRRYRSCATCMRRFSGLRRLMQKRLRIRPFSESKGRKKQGN